MTSKTKTIMTSVILSALLVISATGYASAQDLPEQALNGLEKSAIAKSIKSYEVKNMKVVDARSDIAKNQLTFDFKGKQYELRLFEDERLNNAEFYIEIDGENILQKTNDIAYTGYVVGDPKSNVSLVVSDESVSGFVTTSDKEITLEPISFYGKNFSGERQIAYDREDQEFSFSLDGDIDEKIEAKSKTVDFNLDHNHLLPTAEADSGHTADLRVVTDEDYYDINTSTCGTRVLTIVGGMNSAYYYTDATFNLKSYTCNVDYMTSSSTSGARAQLDNEWDGSSSPTRDLVLGFLGEDKDYAHIGSADSHIPGIQNPQYYGYAVAQLVDDSASNYDASLTEQKILASHEAGHVMGASHENGKISGKYTIMSTAVLDESNFTNQFHSNSKTEIADAADDYL